MTLEEDLELFKIFPSILYLWFEIQGSRTDKFFDWVLNTDVKYMFMFPLKNLARKG